MTSLAEVERLRTEADTIFTRIQTVQDALESARNSEGDHWERGELDLTLETPAGESIAVTLDLEASAAENAQRRYDRASEMEETLEAKREVAGRVAEAPPEPFPFLVLYHLDSVESDDPRSMASDLDADRATVVDACERLERAGLVEPTDEPNQHRTTYRLSTDGDRLLRHLDDREGTANFLRWVDGAMPIARRLSRGGPDYPRMTAEELGMDYRRVRRLYRAMTLVGVLEQYEGGTIKGTERSLKPKDETHRKHTYYVTTRTTDLILRNLD